jgi:hypothetical protein
MIQLNRSDSYISARRSPRHESRNVHTSYRAISESVLSAFPESRNANEVKEFGHG